MPVAMALCLVGLATLIAGAELIVRGGGALAARLGVPPIVIGLTIVAVGTSAPELAVGIDAVLRGAGELAVANIAGTNTVNLLFILGLSALIMPLSLRLQTVRLDLPVMIAAALAMAAMAADGALTRLEGTILIGGGIVYSLALLHVTRLERKAVQTGSAGARVVDYPDRQRRRGAALSSLVLLLLGIAVVVVGADLLVRGAVDLARRLDVSDALIGLTVVAIGTSSPELATTIISTFKGERDIAVGNLLGSSVYNILFILGITCVVPAAGVPVSAELIWIDIPVMAVAALACAPVFLGRRISRVEGGIFVSAYLVYLAYLLIVRA